MEASSLAPAAPKAPVADPASKPQLKHGAISYLSNVVIGVASTAPGYSLAATIGFIVGIAGMGVHMPSVIIVSFIPMFFVARAYRNMNAADPDCGTTFSWVTRAMGPSIGWIAGYTILASDIIVNANQAQIAGSYGLQLAGLSVTQTGTILVGAAFIIILTWICWKGIELSARTQQLLLAFEMGTLVIFAVVALIKTYADNPAGSMHVALSWFNPFAISFGTLIQGMLLGVFLYWGWDTGVSVNEESQNSADAPGRSATTSTLVLIAIFLLVSVASQAFAGTKYLGDPNNAADIFSSGLAKGVLGSLHWLLTIAVLTSATAATQTTILPAARSALSMGRRGAIPSRFASIHAKNLIPGVATIWAGVLSLIWFVFISEVSTNVLADCVAGLGFLVCYYYGFTGFSSAIFYRHELRKSAKNFVTLGLMPVLGGLVLMGIFVKGLTYYGHASNDVSKPLLGLGVPDWIAIIGIGSGVVLMLIRRVTAPQFFREKRLVAGDKIETVTPEAVYSPADQLL